MTTAIRDPLAQAEDANEIAIDARCARDALARIAAGIGTTGSRVAALACLRSARTGIDALIQDIEGQT